MDTIRLALGVEYDGTPFSGWQTQKTGVYTIQHCVETALSKIAAQPVTVLCAGRTDAGVHALEQVIHADIAVKRSLSAWVYGTNTHLPKEISIRWAQPVRADFHARFSATARHYSYRILNRNTRPAIAAGKLTWFYHPLDVARMQAAAAHLLGEHDFSAFRAQGCQAKTPVRTITRLAIQRHGDQVHLEISANAFLQHMVRNIAGVLMAIGCGKAEPDWARQVLASRDRRQGGVTALPDGLYLTGVSYPPEFGIPEPGLLLS
jgi:tRNA pseudouridine38-40 synthase